MTAVEPYATPLPAERDESADVARQLLRAWLLAQESEHTQTAYLRNLAGDAPGTKVPGWLVWCDEKGQDPLIVRRAHVDTYKDVLKQAGYSPNTISQRLAAISSFYQYALAEEIIDLNPVKSVKRPKVDRTVSHAVGLNEDELDLLLDAAEADCSRSIALISVLFFSGLRVGSVVAANVGDLGWNEGERTIRLTVKGGEGALRYLEVLVADSVDAYLAERGRPAKDEPLFVNASGFRIDSAYAWRLIRRLAKQASIKSWERLGPHSLRHSMATHALDRDVPLADVQDILGHKDPKTTRRYDRAREMRGRRPSRVLAERRQKKIAERALPSSPEPLPDEPLPHHDKDEL